jgi:hypothetical protein
MQSSTQQVFEELFRDQENNFCFECGSPSNHWASVNNGVFLCLNCSGLHRGFGVNVSFVRSVNMDSWSDLQLSMMRNGGNLKLRQFFENYKIPSDKPIDFKYRTKAGVYYREMLKACAEGKPLPNPPTLDEGLEIASSKPTSYNPNNITGFGSASNQEQQGEVDPLSLEGMKQGAVTIGTSVASGAKTLATTISDKVSDPNFKEDVKEFGVKVAVGTKDAAIVVAEKSKEIWANRDEYMTKGSDLAKQGYGALSGFFKKIAGSDTGSAPQ